MHLNQENGPHRLAAVRTLDAARLSMRAARPLRRALDDADPRIRTAAYEALRRRLDPTITSLDVAGGAFGIDLVPSQSEPLIYVKRRDAARFALFGYPIQVRPPLFYAAPDNSLLVDAPPGADRVTVVRRSRSGGVSSPPIGVDTDVAQLVAFLGEDPPSGPDTPVRGEIGRAHV